MSNARSRLARAAWLCIQAACGSPEDPKFIQPAPLPTERAAACTPPFFRWASGPGRWSDLDRGVTCSVFVEGDGCVFGIYDDCIPLEETERREWQGIFRGDQATVNAARVGPLELRPPQQCNGDVRPQPNGWLSFQAECTLAPGSSTRQPHLGVVLEAAPQGTPPPSPWLRPGEFVRVDSLLAAAASDGQGQLWLVDDQLSLLRFGQGRLQERIPLSAALQGPNFVRTDEHRVLVGTPEGLVIYSTETATTVSLELSGLRDALLQQDRLWVMGTTAEGRGWTQLWRLSSPPAPQGPALVQPEGFHALAWEGERGVMVTDSQVLELNVSGPEPLITRAVSRPAGRATRLQALGTSQWGFGGTCHTRDNRPQEHCVFVVRTPLVELQSWGVPDVDLALAPVIAPTGFALAGRDRRVLRASPEGRIFTLDRAELDGPVWLDFFSLGDGTFAAVSRTGIQILTAAE